MSLITPAYRLTVYEPRQVDVAENDPLTGSGAVHADPFKIATTSKLAGWKGYLHDVKIKRGGVDFLERKTTTPQATFTLRDQRLTEGGSNLIRWWTGLMSAAGGSGKFQQSRCKVVIEESLDWNEDTATGTWTVSFTGRIDIANVKGMMVRISAYGMSRELLEARIFTRRPHASVANAVETELIPLGISAPFGTIPAAPILRGVVGNASSGVGKSVKLDSTSAKNAYNIITRALRRHDGNAALTLRGSTSTMRRYEGTARARIRNIGAGTTGDMRFLTYTMFHREEGHFSIPEVGIEALPVGTEQYIALPADGTQVEISIRPALSEPSKEAPLILGEAHLLKYWEYIIDGKFGDLRPDGTVLRSWDKDAATFATLLADPTFGTRRFIVTGPEKAMDWGQSFLNKDGGVTIVENALGQMKPIDLRIPTSLAGIVTLDDADLAADDELEWESNASDAIQRAEIISYVDDFWRAEDLTALTGFFPDIPACLISSTDETTVEPDFSAGGGGQTLRIDAKGLRSSPGEAASAAVIHQNEVVRGQIIRALEEYRVPYGAGPQRTTVVCRRSAKVQAVQPGDWRIVQFSKLPDPTTNLRGGPRLVRVLDKSEDGPKVTLKLLDAGPNATCIVPVIGALAAGPDAQHEVSIPITVNASNDPIKVEVAYTDTAVGAAPAVGDVLWNAIGRFTASQTVISRNGLPGKRCWVRIRSEPNPARKEKALPSAWVFAAPAFRDLTALSAFATLAVSDITSRAAKLTVGLGGNTKDHVRLLISSAASKVLADATTPVPWRDYPPGSTEIFLAGLDQAGPWYKVQVAPFDGIVTTGPVVGIAATSFEATGTPAKWPKLAGVSPLGGTTILSAVQAVTYQRQVVRTGNAFNLLPAQIGLDIIVQRAPDAGGAPGAWAEQDSVPAFLIRKEGYVWSDEIPTGTPYWYRFAHRGDGGTDSDWTEPLLARPGVLPKEIISLKSPGLLPRDRAVAGQERAISWATAFLVPNGEFDTWETDSQPAGWSVDATGVCVRDRVVKMSGDAALKYTLNAAGWHGITTDEETVGPFCMPLRAGRRYRLQVGLRASTLGGGAAPEARLTLTFDAGALLTDSRTFRFTVAGAYDVFTWVVDVPDNAEPNSRLAIEFNRQGIGGSVDFHVDSLRPDEDGAELGSVAVFEADHASQVVPNWHFEAGYAFWRRYDNTYRSVFIEGATALRGALGVRMGTGVYQNAPEFADLFIISCDRPTDDISDGGDPLYVPVEPGQEILVKVRSKVNAGGFANVEVGILEHATPTGLGAIKVLTKDDNTITTEQERTAVYTIPAGVNWITPFLRIQGGATINLLWDVDDLQVWRFPRKQRVKAYRSATQALTSGVAAAVSLNGDVFNPDGWHNTGVNPTRITPQLGLGTAVAQGGLLLLHGQVGFAASTTGVYRVCRIRKNGATIIGEHKVEEAIISSPDPITLPVTAVDHAWTPGDYYELIAEADANINVLAGADQTWLFATHLL